jgi:hypothetical protein
MATTRESFQCAHGWHDYLGDAWMTPDCACEPVGGGLAASEGDGGVMPAPEPHKALSPEIQGVKELTWRAAITRATASGDLDPATLGHALVFAQGGFDYSTGRQTQAKAPAYLTAQGMGSVAGWKRHLAVLVESGWLTPCGEVRQGPRPTRLYLLTLPMAQK